MRGFRFFLVTCSFVAGAAAAANAAVQGPAPGVVDGLVTDTALVALTGATVSILQTSLHVETGESGRFRIIGVPPSSYLVTVRRLGFAPLAAVVTVVPGDTLRLSFMLPPSVPVLDAAVSRVDQSVTRLQGFEERRQRDVGGRYITRADIDAQSPRVTSDLLRRVIGVRMVDSLGVLVPVSSRGPKIAHGANGELAPVQCKMRIAVDGFLMEPGFAMNSIAPADVHGIEIYAGPADVPPEYNAANTDSFCGLIIIWTRSG
jgi:hypothetical protein